MKTRYFLGRKYRLYIETTSKEARPMVRIQHSLPCENIWVTISHGDSDFVQVPVPLLEEMLADLMHDVAS